MNNTVTQEIKNQNTQTEGRGTLPILSREQVLSMIGECLGQIHGKLQHGRIRTTDKDKARNDLLKVQGYLSGIYLQGLKDLELEQLNERIAALEAERARQ